MSLLFVVVVCMLDYKSSCPYIIDSGPVLASVVVRAADPVADDLTLGTSLVRRASRHDQHGVGPVRRVRSSDRGTSPLVGVKAGACHAVGVRMGAVRESS